MRDSSLRPAAGVRRNTLLAALAALVLVVAICAFPSLRPTGLMRDFSAFYCAGAAIDRGADPYLAEPIGACERTPKPFGLDQSMEGLSVPAPLPPFALALFAIVARLPYGTAAALWFALSIVAFAISIVALRRLGVETVTAIAALALTDGYASFALGQVAPFAIAALLAGAASIERGSPLGGAIAALALVEPHLAIPSLVALLLRRKESRVPILLVSIALVAIGLLTLGAGTNVEYLRDVLPAHARSEIASTRQFSLTTILAELGASPAIALGLGNLSYALAALAGIAAAVRLADRYGASLLVLAPMAFAVVGGPFVHIVQMAAAIPLGLVLAARGESGRAVLVTSLLALSSPWIQFASLGGVFDLLAAIVAAALVLATGGALRLAVLAAVGAIAMIGGVEALVTQTPPDVTADLVAHFDPHALAEDSWTRYVAGVGASDRLAYDLARLPTWLGALGVVTIAIRLALRGKGSRRSPRIPTPYL